MSLGETQKFQFSSGGDDYITSVIMQVYRALEEKGYNPISQMVGYVLSGDPTYITGHKGARSLIMKIERDEILEALVRYFVANNS